MSSPSTSPSQAKTLAHTFCAAFEHLDFGTHQALRTPTCTHTFLPASLGIGPFTNDEFAHHLARLHGVLATFPVTPVEIIEATRERKVVIWATSQANFNPAVIDADADPAEWKYRGEYIFMLSLSEAGDRIERVVEFVDSAGSMRLLGLVERARANLNANANKGEMDE